ncbi:hypothetical protein GCM10007169_10000 [Shewanella fodinae]|nr:hypothetical protein GCM10007169_10000 [Shewanella fodinae]
MSAFSSIIHLTVAFYLLVSCHCYVFDTGYLHEAIQTGIAEKNQYAWTAAEAITVGYVVDYLAVVCPFAITTSRKSG